MDQQTRDHEVLDHIQRLSNEEHRLYEQGSLADVDRQRLREIQVELDQCWDLLRQRRARREMGQDPNAPHVRSAEVVENYQA
ncbi:MAG: DUF2630 family protein [Gammaproteobacteria bacterium]